MTIKKLTKWDKFVRRCSDKINKLGFRRLSGKMLDYIAARHGCPKNKGCWIHKNYIEY